MGRMPARRPSPSPPFAPDAAATLTVPRYDRWPVALRAAERLRGTLVPCGPGLRGIGWPDTPRVRLAALGGWLGQRRVATLTTAAWVWGAAREPGDPLRLSTARRGRHTDAPSREIRVQELCLSPVDVTALGGFAVTTPLRTAADLLHDPEGFDRAHEVAVRLLGAQIEGGLPALAARLADHRRPHRRLAIDRLRRVRGVGAG